MRSCLLLLLLASPALADGWHTTLKLQMRNDRLGLGAPIDHGYRVTLYDDSDNMLLKGGYVESGFTAFTSPASVGPGLYVQAVPVAFLRLRADVQSWTWFGAFNSLQEFSGKDPDWSPERLDELRGKGRPGRGIRANMQAVVQLKVGPVFAFVDNQLQYLKGYGVALENTWYHDQNDLLIDAGDFVHVSRSTLGAILYGEISGEFLALAGHFEHYEALDQGTTRQIAGMLGLWRPVEEWWGKPTLYMIAGAFVEDEYKTGNIYVAGQIVFTLDHSVK